MMDMIIKSFQDVFSPSLRPILIKSVLLAIAILIILGYFLSSLTVMGIDWLTDWLGQAFMESEWVTSITDWLGLNTLSGLEAVDIAMSGVAIVLIGLGLVFLIIPVSGLICSIFLDDIAKRLEARDYPSNKQPMNTHFIAALWNGIKFFFLVIGVNLLAFLLYLIPFVNIGIFIIANGYLISREYFDMIARRHLGGKEAKALYKSNKLMSVICGIVTAMLAGIPILNLIMPVFATALFCHLYHDLKGPDRLESEI